MKSATIRELKQELQDRPAHEVMALCLRLCRFKKENKELMTYLLFEAQDEESFIESVKQELDQRFEQVNRKSPYFVRKSFRSILQHARKFIRYSSNKETEVELLLHYCRRLKEFKPDIRQHRRQLSIHQKLTGQLEKKICALHEDLHYDYLNELKRVSF
jgi:hypothetical protein